MGRKEKGGQKVVKEGKERMERKGKGGQEEVEEGKRKKGGQGEAEEEKKEMKRNEKLMLYSHSSWLSEAGGRENVCVFNHSFGRYVVNVNAIPCATPHNMLNGKGKMEGRFHYLYFYSWCKDSV